VWVVAGLEAETMSYQGKHYRRYPRRPIVQRIFGTWTQNKLLSRKWWLISATVSGVVVLDVLGRTLGEPTLHYLEIAVPAYLVVEGALDWRYKRKREQAKESAESEDVI
jgi:hypothetical protein